MKYAILFLLVINGCASSGALESKEPAERLAGDTRQTWVLTEIHMHDDNRIAPNRGGEYTLNFENSGGIRGRADCNSYFGQYTREGNAISVGSLASSRAMCEESSISAEYLRALGDIETYTFEGDHLILTFGKGHLKFEPDSAKD